MNLNKADVEEVKDISTTQNSVENRKKRKRSRWDQTGSSKVQATTEFSVDSKIRGVATTNSGSNGGSSSSSSSIGTTKTFVSTTTTNVTLSPPNSTVKTDSTQITSPQNTPEKKLYVKYSDTYKPGMIRVGSKWVYPEDEIIDGGTWEHKKRAEEMKKTAEHAALLTAQAEAKRAHHIADFLPKTELVKFEEEVKAIKTGGPAPQHEDYASNKLDQSNIGFKMLMKQGWQAGSGLGKSGEGISAPVNKADTRPTNAGLGQTKPDDVQEEDDEFEIYRKRMMLAYRFRPNPLNNPRRPYY